MKKSLLFMITATLGLALAMPAVAVDIPSEVTLIRNVNIFNGESDKLLMGYDVLVVKNIIKKIDKNIQISNTILLLTFIFKRAYTKSFWYRPHTTVNLNCSKKLSYYSAALVRYSRMSAINILPAPPGVVTLPLVPRPIAILSTSARLIP